MYYSFPGHLLEMIEATGIKASDQYSNYNRKTNIVRSCEDGNILSKNSDVKVELNISSLPVLPGALECFKLGAESTLQPSNIKVGEKYVIYDGMERSDNPLRSILYDPQTSGGLIASIPAQSVSKRLHDSDKKNAI